MTKLDLMVKVAGRGESAKKSSGILKKLLFPVTVGAVGAGVSYGLMPYLQKKKMKKEEEVTWQQIQKLVPDLAKKEGVREHFNAMHDVTPKVMSHPSFAIPVLRQSADYGTEGIPLQLLQSASGTEHGSAGLKSPDKLALPVSLMGFAGGLS